MAYKIIDTTGEITEGSLFLPGVGVVPIPGPVKGQVTKIKEALADTYGERFEVKFEAPTKKEEVAKKETKKPSSRGRRS